jgi:hypothetical protein
MKKFCVISAWAIGFLLLYSSVSVASTPVRDSHIEEINRAFRSYGITNGYVVLDQYGRLELKGDYIDERQVDQAFSLAQQVVGVKWVSPVTPENIKVKEWEKKIGGLFSRAAILKPETLEGPPGPIRNKYALVVGVGKFKFGITELQYSVRDATAFYNFVVDPNRGNFPRNNVYFLANENATRQNVARYLDAIRNVANPDDLVAVYMSSHGTPPDKFGGVHVVSYDTEVKPRDRVWQTAITENMLKEFVENLRAKRLVMILDTCYSNGAYRAIPGFLPPGGKSLGVDTEDEGYGVSKEYGKRVFGAKDIVLEDEPKPKTASAKNVGDSQDGYGKVLIGASSAGEKSWESDSLKNSVFTYYFVDGLQRYQGNVKDAFYYAKPLVDRRVKQEKGAEISQNPQAMATNQDWNMKLVKR